MFKCLLWTYCSLAIVVCVVIVYALIEFIIGLKYPQTRGDKHLVYCAGFIIIGIFIECCLAYAISNIWKKIQSRTRRERAVETLVNKETRVFRRRDAPEDFEMSPRTEETSLESGPVIVEGPLTAAYDQNRLDAITDTIRRARENMGIIYPVNPPNVPESVKRY